MSVKTPIVDRIIHSTAVRMTPAMPSATESRKLIFITDHGSTRATARRTRRGRACARRVAVRAPAAVGAPDWPEPTCSAGPHRRAGTGRSRLVAAPRESRGALVGARAPECSPRTSRVAVGRPAQAQ